MKKQATTNFAQSKIVFNKTLQQMKKSHFSFFHRIAFLFLLLFSLHSNVSFANSGFFGIGGGLISYNINGAGQVNSYNYGANLGSVSSFTLMGGINHTFKDATGNVCSGLLSYIIYKQGNRPVSPTFSTVSLGFSSNNTFTTIAIPANITGSNGGDQRWLSNGANINVLNTANSSGTWVLEVFWSYTGSTVSNSACGTTIFLNNGGSNYTWTFNNAAFDPPTIATTNAASAISNTGASSGGQTLAGTVTAKGVVWSKSSTSTTPTLGVLGTNLDGSTSDGSGTANFTSPITGLPLPQNLYYVRAYATNANGTNYAPAISFYSSSNPPTSAASGFSATTISTSQIDLAWTSAGFPGSGANNTGYIILRRTDGANPSSTGVVNGTAPASLSLASGTTLLTTIASGATLSFSNTGIGSGQYNYTIIPFTWDGINTGTYNYFTTSAPSATAFILASEPAAQPTNISFASVTATSLIVNWTAASGPPTGYIVLQSPGAIPPNTDPADGTFYTAGNTLGNAKVVYQGTAISSGTLTLLTDNTNYNYKIFSYNGTAGGVNYLTSIAPLSGNQSTTPIAAPVANAATNGATSFTANWSVSAGAQSYQLDVSTDNLFGSFVSGYQNLAVSGGATVSQIVTGLSSGTPYYYRVRAVGTNSTSGNSNTITLTTLTPIFSNAVVGDWSSAASWVGGIVPNGTQDVVIVSGAVITRSSTLTQTASITVDAGGTLAVTAVLTTNGNVTINGTFKISGTLAGGGSPAVVGTGTWTYSQTTGTLLFNSNATYNIDANTVIFWPSAAGSRPFNVSVLAVSNGNALQINNGVARTIDGTLRIGGSAVNNASLFANGGGTYTVNGTLQIDIGGLFSNQVVTYGASSTLKFNTGTTFTYSGNGIWVSGGTVGTVGVAHPANVQISGNTVMTMPNSIFNCAGNLTIDNGSSFTCPSSNTFTANGNVLINGTLILGPTSGADFTVNGNWTRNSSGSTFTPNGRAVWFSGSGIQTITLSAGGTEVFNYLLNNNSSGGLSLGAATDVAVNAVTGDPLQLLNAGTFNLNGRTLYLSGSGGNIKTSGGARTISGNGTLAIQGNKFVTSALGGSLSIGANILVDLTAGIDFGANLTTLNGTLQISAGGFVSNNAPFYGNGSLLKYNSATNPYVRGVEWSTASGAGYPYNVQISNTTNLDPAGTINAGVALNVANNLTVDGGCGLYMDFAGHNMTVSLIVANDLNLNGGLSASGASGGDIVLRGNWNRTGTFTPNNRAVYFQGNNIQSLTGSTGFDYVIIDKPLGSFTLLNNMTVNQTLTFTALNAVNITTGSNKVIISSTGSVSRNSGYINGNEQRNFAIGTNVSRTFDIGDATNYTPVTLTFASVTGAGDVLANTVNSDQPQLAASLLNANKSVNRYWTLSNAGVIFNTYDLSVNFVSGDLDGAVSTSNLKMGKYNGSWNYPSLGTITSTSVQGTGISTFSDFALAECLTPTLLITNPTSVCHPATVDLTAASVTFGSDAGLTYTYWGDANASTNPISALAAASISIANTYYIKGTNAAGCFDIKAVVVSFNTNPTAVISGDAIICNGNSSNLSIAVTGTGPWSGTLSDAGATAFSGNSSPITVSVSPISTFTYAVATLQDANCAATVVDLSGSATITVNANPATPTISSNGPNTFCQGESVTLTSSPEASYLWSTGETTSSILVDYSDVISVTVSNSNACPATSASTTITVTPASLTPFSVAAASPYVYGFENASVPQVVCGMAINNDNFPADNEQWKTATTAANSGTKHMALDANADGLTAKNDWFYTAPLSLQAGKLYRILFSYKGTNAIKTEQFDVYAGTTTQSFDMLSGSPIYTNNNVTNTIYVEDSTSDFIPALSGEYYFGFFARSAANQGSLYIDDLTVKEITVTQLQPGSCTTLGSMYDQIFCSPVPGASDYKYRVVNTATSFNYEYTRNLPLNDFRLKWAPGVLYGLTYDVSTAYFKNGVWSAYGASCPVTMGPFPSTKLTIASCGSSISNLSTALYSDTISGATDYEYKIVNVTQGYDHTWSRGSAQNDYRLSWAYSYSPYVQELPYGYTYDIQVRAQVGKTASLAGQWGTFGPTCQVIVTGTPGTQLTPLYCGSSLSTLISKFYCIPVGGASDYEYRISNTALGFSQTGTRGNSSTDYQLNWLPNSTTGIRYATTYNVEVRAKVGGIFGNFGTLCQLTTPASPLTSLQAGYCNFTLPSFSSQVFCVQVPGTSNYRYHITGPLGYDKTFTRNSGLNDWRFSWTLQCCGQQNMLPNSTYTVEVASYAGGAWSNYGAACSITTGASVPRYAAASDELPEEMRQGYELSVYPNPATTGEQITLEVNGMNLKTESIELHIYNLLGEKVYQASVSSAEESRLTLSPEKQFAPGIYVAEARVNAHIFRSRFVVK